MYETERETDLWNILLEFIQFHDKVNSICSLTENASLRPIIKRNIAISLRPVKIEKGIQYVVSMNKLQLL